MEKNEVERSRAIRSERKGSRGATWRENIISEWAKYSRLDQAKKIETISTEQGDQSGEEQVDIKGEKLELHAQDIFGKREVAHINRDGTPRFSKGVE